MHTLKLVSLACAASLIVSSVSCGGSSTSPEAGDASATDTGGAIDSGGNAETSGNDATGDLGGEVGGDAADTTSGDGTASGCITDTSAGSRVFTCDGFKYDVTVPVACAAGGCGLVLDVHGATMSGKMEDANTDMRALGAKYGYVVVQPNANPAPPSSSWNPAADDPKVFAFFQDALAAFKIDKKKVHMTGFSQGGMMSSRFLCKHADAFASIAPAAGTGCTFTGSDTPSEQIDVLYMHGTKDALVSFSAGTAQRDALIAAWKMTGETVVGTDAAYKWSRWKSPTGTTFEFIQHDYQAKSFLLKGHCYPGSKDKGTEPGQLFPFNCTDTTAFTWGDVVMQFFIAHPRK